MLRRRTAPRNQEGVLSVRGYPHEEKNSTPKYTPEVLKRAIRLLEEVRAQHPSDWAAIQAIASKIGCNPETLRAWYRKHQDAQNPAAVAQQAQDARIKALERENYERKRSNEILRKAAAFFAQAELDRKPK